MNNPYRPDLMEFAKKMQEGGFKLTGGRYAEEVTAMTTTTPNSDELDNLIREYSGMDFCGADECLGYQMFLEFKQQLQALITSKQEALLDRLEINSPRKLQLPKDARSKIRGGYYKAGWNDANNEWIDATQAERTNLKEKSQ